MTFEVIVYEIQNLHLYIVSFHLNFHQNRFINECARKEKAKIPKN